MEQAREPPSAGGRGRPRPVAGAGVTSCPNGIADPAALAAALGLAEDETPVTILSFGYPDPPRHPERREAAAWSRRANRLPLEDVAVRVP